MAMLTTTWAAMRREPRGHWGRVAVLAAACGLAGPVSLGAPFDVWYRPGPEARWTLYGGRGTRAAADAEAAELKRMAGYETKVSAVGEPRPDLVGAEAPLGRTTAVRGTTYVARPGLGYAAGWARHWGGWSGWGGGWGGAGWGGGGWGGGYRGGGGYSGSWSHHHHSSHHHSHEHHSSHTGNHPTAHPSHSPRAGARGGAGHGSAAHHAHSHSHSHSHSSHHSHSHGGHHR